MRELRVGRGAVGATVAVSLEKIIGLPWRLEKLRAEKELLEWQVREAKSAAEAAQRQRQIEFEKAQWEARKAKAEAELAELDVVIRRREAGETETAIQSIAKRSLHPIGSNIDTEEPAPAGLWWR